MTVDAVVVGSGPNGLAAAITLAAAGRSVVVLEGADVVGGGLRSDEIAEGHIRDRCAAVMPFAVGTPFLASIADDLARHGLEWIYPEISFTHPLDDGRAAVAFPSLEDTIAALGGDGRRYRRLVGPVVDHWWDLAEDLMGPIVHVPHHPLRLAQFGLPALASARRLASLFSGDEAKSLLAGTGAHGIVPLDRPTTGAFALLFAASAHAAGWPVVAGGSQELAAAMVSLLEELGGRVETGRSVRSMSDLPASHSVLFDTNPGQVAAIAGDRLSARERRRFERFAHGPGMFKVDYILDGPVPWSDPWSSRAGTVHIGGTFAEVAEAEHIVAEGGHPERPFVLVAQQSVIDTSRAPVNRHVLWTYTHVPSASSVDMTDAIDRQIERFAPGFRDLIIERDTLTGPALQAYNPNCVGGDIGGGSNRARGLLARPTIRRPYNTSAPGLFLCSASTPPGGGIHGMAGHLAAKTALKTTLA